MKAYFDSRDWMKVLTYLCLSCQSVLTETATFKRWIYVSLWSDKKKPLQTVGRVRCFVSDDVWAAKCPPLVPVWGQTVAFHWTNTPVFSDKSVRQVNITSLHHEPTLTSSVNLQLQKAAIRTFLKISCETLHSEWICIYTFKTRISMSLFLPCKVTNGPRGKNIANMDVQK